MEMFLYLVLPLFKRSETSLMDVSGQNQVFFHMHGSCILISTGVPNLGMASCFNVHETFSR